MEDVLNFWFTLVGVVVSDLFNYPLIGDVTLGWFILACLLVELVLLFVFHRLVN